jgi:hypothetical protein
VTTNGARKFREYDFSKGERGRYTRRIARIQGARVRCLISPDRYVTVGQFYEVAEILEHPYHIMIRKPNGKWPRPGDPFFAWHPDEYFESPPTGIPALSCGYQHEDLEFFGTIIPNSLFPTPSEWDPFKPNTALAREEFSDIVDGVGIRNLWWRSFYKVLPKVCFPKSLERNFLILGIDFEYLRRSSAKHKAVSAIHKIMRRLSIPSKLRPPVEDQSIEFWRTSWRKPGPLRRKSPEQVR